MLELDEEIATGLMRRSLALVQKLDWNLPPPLLAREMHRAIREMTNNADPYLAMKIEATETALSLLPDIEEVVAASAQPFLTAVKVSIGGNIIDLGAKTRDQVDIKKAFHEALESCVDEAAVDRFTRALSEADDVLFLADNAGEIVFDRPLLELIGRDKVTVVVRGSPIINDATLDDARRSGLTSRFSVVSNGSDTPGTWLDDCSKEFVERFDSADLVIAKGQGNFETLSNHPRNMFFLFLAKCPLVADKAGAKPGAYILQEKTGKK